MMIGERYEVTSRLGSGGMSVVYRARDTRLSRDVAVKVLNPNTTGTRGALLFHREAQAMAALQHANIVRVYDYSGARDGQMYLVMELVDGPTVEKLIVCCHPLPENVLLACGAGVASALAHAHGMGLVHRDVKPSNIMVDSGGRVLLMDFGIAKSYAAPAAGEPTLGGGAQTTVLIGTPHFMAPEQLVGKAAEPASDVFSLGASLYCMATGYAPFDTGASAITTLLRPPAAQFVPVEQRRPNLSPDIACLIEACLSSAPNERPTSSDALSLLEAAVRKRDIAAPSKMLAEFLRLHAPESDLPAAHSQSQRKRTLPLEDDDDAVGLAYAFCANDDEQIAKPPSLPRPRPRQSLAAFVRNRPLQTAMAGTVLGLILGLSVLNVVSPDMQRQKSEAKQTEATHAAAAPQNECNAAAAGSCEQRELAMPHAPRILRTLRSPAPSAAASEDDSVADASTNTTEERQQEQAFFAPASAEQTKTDPSAAAETTTGTLELVLRGSASVAIDNLHRGDDLERKNVFELPVGQHEIVISRPETAKVFRKTLSVRAGEVHRLVVDPKTMMEFRSLGD